MNNRTNRLYTLISIVFLAIAVITVSSYVYFSQPSVGADVQQSEISDDFYSLKKGLNYFPPQNKVIDTDSRIISINRSLISVQEARNRGIITGIYLVKNGTIISGDQPQIAAGQDFAIDIEDVSLAPQVYLGE